MSIYPGLPTISSAGLGCVNLSVPGAFKSIFSGNTAAGNVDLYTAPGGKRALFSCLHVYNPTGGSITYFVQLKSGGTYYQLSGTSAVGTLVAGQQISVSIILEPGESIAVNTTALGLNITGSITEFPSTVNFRTVKLLALATGDNLLYTVPAGLSAFILQNNPFAANAPGRLSYFNTSGGSRTISANVVPNAGAVASTNQIINGTVVLTGAALNLGVGVTYNAGDSIHITTDANTATQIAYLTVMEQ